jgi:flotillin
MSGQNNNHNLEHSHSFYYSHSDPINSKIMCLFDTFFGFRYLIPGPNQYIARTGVGIDGVEINKSVMKKPFQKAKIIDITPRNYSFDLHAMSSEKLSFVLPSSYTVSVNVIPDDPEATKKELKKFAIFLIGADKSLDSLIKGIIEGETRVLAANMTLEDIFQNRATFKQQIIENVHKELEQFGLKVFNANIKELQDAPGSEYFTYMRQKIKETTINQAKVDVAEARLKGTVGEKDREGKSRQYVAGVESDTVIMENDRQRNILESKSKLAIFKAEFDKNASIAELNKTKEIERTDHELSIQVEQINQKRNLEKLRADLLSKASVEYETMIKNSEAKARQMIIEADAKLHAERMRADAMLYAKQQEAAGIEAIYNAEAKGVGNLCASLGNDPQSVVNYLMIEKGVYQKLSEQNAKAIQGLQPKITIWNNGSDPSAAMDPIKNIIKSVPPLLSTIQDQLGYKPPAWMGTPNANNDG